MARPKSKTCLDLGLCLWQVTWLAEVSGGAHQQEAARQAAACVAWMKTQIAQIRRTVAGITARVSHDSSALQAEEDRVCKGLARVKAAQKLVTACKDYSALINDALGVRQAGLEDLTARLQDAQVDLQSLRHGRMAESADAEVRTPST